MSVGLDCEALPSFHTLLHQLFLQLKQTFKNILIIYGLGERLKGVTKGREFLYLHRSASVNEIGII